MSTAFGFGQGYTANVISGVANYIAADRSVLGQLDGRTANIAYSKMVWGKSGEQLFVSNDSLAPTALPVNFSTPENQWFYDTFSVFSDVGVVTFANGATAINVNLFTGLSGISISNLNLDFSAGFTITGVCAGISLPAAVYYLPGMSGGTAQRFMMVGNYVNNVGNITPITVTFGNIPGGTVSIGNFEGTFVFDNGGVTVQGSYADGTIGVTFGPTAQVPVQVMGFRGNSVGIPVFGISGGTALPVSVTGPVSIAGWSGATVGSTAGIPVYGVSGSFPINSVLVKNIGGTITPLLETVAVSGGTTLYGIPIVGLTASPISVQIVGTSGSSFVTLGGTSSRPIYVEIASGGLSGINISSGITLLGFGSGTGNNEGIPVFGVSGGTAIGVTFTQQPSVYGGITFGTVLVKNIGGTITPLLETIGVSGGATQYGLPVVGVTGSPLAVTIVGGLSGITVTGITISIPSTFSISQGVTLLGFGSGTGNNQGIPVFGVSGGTAIGVTFGPEPIKVMVTSPAQAGGAAINVFPVNVFSHTISQPVPIKISTTSGENNITVVNTEPNGVFVRPSSEFYDTNVDTDLKTHLEKNGGLITSLGGSAGVTIGGINTKLFRGLSGIFGNTNGIGVSFSAIIGDVGVFNSTLLDSQAGIRVQGSANSRDNSTSGVPLGVTLLGVAGTTALNATYVPGSSSGTQRALVVTQRAGPVFAVGLTLSNLFWSSDFDPDNPAATTFFELDAPPVCVTKGYTGPGKNGTLPNGEVSVPLKQGLYIQLTKWDFVSHVYIGYTASNTYEFARNAQVLFREYQVAPIWASAMDQFRRYTGVTGNVIAREFAQGPGLGLAEGNFNASDASGVTLTTKEFTPKPYVGVIEKPTRLFIPCRDAGEIYVQPKGSYNDHAMGSGFFDYETGEWSATSLYERNHFADNWWQLNNAFTSQTNEPNLSASGNVTDLTQYTGTASIISGLLPDPGETTGLSGASANFPTAINPVVAPCGGCVIAQILATYTNNPFIRVWGY